MSKESFRLLADKLRVQLQIKPRAPKKTGGMISVELRLSLTLRMLAGGSYLDIIDVHGISESSFWAIFHQVVHLLSGTKVLDNILFPYTDPAKLADIATGFAAKSPPGHMWGCVGALDGIAIRMWEPTASDCCNPRSYYNRKGFHALNCQAMVDSHGRFLWMDIRTPGSTHDSVAWRVRPLAWALLLQVERYHTHFGLQEVIRVKVMARVKVRVEMLCEDVLLILHVLQMMHIRAAIHC